MYLKVPYVCECVCLECEVNLLVRMKDIKRNPPRLRLSRALRVADNLLTILLVHLKPNAVFLLHTLQLCDTHTHTRKKSGLCLCTSVGMCTWVCDGRIDVKDTLPVPLT